MGAGPNQAFDDPHVRIPSAKVEYEPWDGADVIQGMTRKAIANLSNRNLNDLVNALSPMVNPRTSHLYGKVDPDDVWFLTECRIEQHRRGLI
jgi:hypothetical protein